MTQASMIKETQSRNAHKARKDMYEEITSTILASLEAGTVPWHQPWTGGGIPKSMSTGKAYRGVNAFLLSLMGRTSPFWGTYKQIAALGGQVRKGEKSTPVVFWKILDGGKDANGKDKKIPLLRSYNVFNADQADGLPEKYHAAPAIDFEPLEAAEAILEGYDGPMVTYGGDRAAYSPSADVIMLPNREQFKSADAFYSTAFHEMTHSTGHKSRLNREGVTEGHSFGSEMYGKEELVAEMGAAMLSGMAGIHNVTVGQSAAYLASWIKTIKGDPKMVVQAAAQAQKAADLILGVTWEKEEDDA